MAHGISEYDINLAGLSDLFIVVVQGVGHPTGGLLLIDMFITVKFYLPLAIGS